MNTARAAFAASIVAASIFSLGSTSHAQTAESRSGGLNPGHLVIATAVGAVAGGAAALGSAALICRGLSCEESRETVSAVIISPAVGVTATALGVSLIGNSFGGRGSFRSAWTGAALGTVVWAGIYLGALSGSNDGDADALFYSSPLFAAVGATLGYALSHGSSSAPAVTPNFAMSRGGFSAGVSGSF